MEVVEENDPPWRNNGLVILRDDWLGTGNTINIQNCTGAGWAANTSNSIELRCKGWDDVSHQKSIRQWHHSRANSTVICMASMQWSHRIINWVLQWGQDNKFTSEIICHTSWLSTLQPSLDTKAGQDVKKAVFCFLWEQRTVLRPRSSSIANS